MSQFTDAVERLEATDKTDWLGKLAWFSVNETKFPHDTLEAELKAVGLEKFCPTAPRDDDVFRRVFYNGQRKSHDLGDGIKENLLIRQVKRQGGEIIKRIVVETVDAKGNKLGIDTEGVEVKFRAGGAGIRIRQRSDQPEALRLAHKLKAEYLQERGCVNANAVREIVRNIFLSLRAITVRSGGGVYFVPATLENITELGALEKAAEKLPGTLVHSLPLVDDDKQRNNLKRAFEAETVGECDRLIAELTEITKSDTKITDERGDGYLRNLKASKAKLREYAELLEDSLDDAEMRLQVLERKVVQVIKSQTKD
jgi:hypothetical protein